MEDCIDEHNIVKGFAIQVIVQRNPGDILRFLHLNLGLFSFKRKGMHFLMNE